ncbi:LOW QUALITY PROTEIN: uncharacterized protein [Venturia canescens]|uniref:LOW QUALITY PROTEIN: uncharacterized protein n=1 Tax=Venturia canescens TaxID=32260 RepID=UPI001C9D13A3|nr:LOW QUALITY PROTEIN: uncharacterized protein LOC122410303 [Venturia canescens]
MNDKKGYRDKNGCFAKTDKKTWRKNIGIANSNRADKVKQSLAKGRRIFDVERLAHEMWCPACDIPLSLRFIEKESLIGLASIMTIKCYECEMAYKVKTSAESEQCGYSINALLALAIFDAGVGCSEINKILSVLNIPTIHNQLIKRNERTVGLAIEKVAHASCVEALKLERDMTITCSRSDTGEIPASIKEFPNTAENTAVKELVEIIPEEKRSSIDIVNNAHSKLQRRKLKAKIKNEEFKASKLKAAIELFQIPKTQETLKNIERFDSTMIDPQTKVGLTLSFDGAWQKSGRAHNSMTGHATAVGSKTGLCVGYDVCTTRCRECAAGNSKDLHDCRINHYGSAKAMKPAMAERIMLQNPDFESERVELQTLIGDDDSSTIACLRRKSDHSITKFCNKNHAVTKISSSMYNAKLSTAAVDYLKYLFKCAIEKNGKDVSLTRQAILNIVPHAFGDHVTCGDWCKHTDEKNKYTRLPGGKPLSGDTLKCVLMSIFKRYADKSEELAPGASSQINESLNRLVATHHPKDKYYGGSSSIHARVGAAICQKNMGTVYIDAVKTELALSPSIKRSLRYRSLLDNARKRQALYSQSAEGKNDDGNCLKLGGKKQYKRKIKKGFVISQI